MPRRTPTARSGRPPRQRQLRVGEQIRHVLSEALAREAVRDPDVAGRSITVTEVRVSPDLRSATAFVVPLGGGLGDGSMGGADADIVVAGLQRAAVYLRGLIGKEMQLRLVPTLTFTLDTGFDQAARIDSLLASAPRD